MNPDESYYGMATPGSADAFPSWLAFLIFLVFVAFAIWLYSITPKKRPMHEDDRA